MRISDWSSDVCSSDLLIRRLGGRKRAHAQKLLAVGVAGADQRLIQNFDLGQGIGRLVDALNGGIKRASDKGQPADAAFGEVFAKRLDGAPDLPGEARDGRRPAVERRGASRDRKGTRLHS